MPHSELVQSLLRGIDVIELLAQSERGISLSEICQALNLKQPTAHNLIRTLIHREYVEKTSSPVRYRLGASVTRLARERSSQSIVRSATTVMNRFLDELRPQLPAKLAPDEEVAITFSQHIGGEVMMVLRLRVQRPGIVERPQFVFGAYESAAALCFQAYWTPDEREAFWRRHPFAELGAPFWKTMDRLKEFLDKVPQLGYSLPPIFPLGRLRVAAPVFGQGREIVGVLGLGVWLESGLTQRRRLIEQVVAAARRIGATAGHEAVYAQAGA